jgi:hypothetical protein
LNRAFFVLCILLVAVSFLFARAAHAEADPETDYCQQRADACVSQCDQYNARLWGTTIPTPRSALCVAECTVAYVGCIMMRFREGV